MPSVETQLTPDDQPPLPDLSILKVPADQVLLFKAHAKGLQIYPCANNTFGKARPEAALLTDQGEIIHHFQGPTWQAADGSSLVGTLLHNAGAPYTDAIPWLLLSATPGGTLGGKLSKVTFIQRVHTKYGLPPAGPCDSPAGTETPVYYEADYYFYVLKEGQ